MNPAPAPPVFGDDQTSELRILRGSSEARAGSAALDLKREHRGIYERAAPRRGPSTFRTSQAMKVDAFCQKALPTASGFERGDTDKSPVSGHFPAGEW